MMSSLKNFSARKSLFRSHLVPCFYSNERGKTTLFQEIANMTIFYSTASLKKPGSNVLEWTGTHTIHCTLPNSVHEIKIKS